MGRRVRVHFCQACRPASAKCGKAKRSPGHGVRSASCTALPVLQQRVVSTRRATRNSGRRGPERFCVDWNRDQMAGRGSVVALWLAIPAAIAEIFVVGAGSRRPMGVGLRLGVDVGAATDDLALDVADLAVVQQAVAGFRLAATGPVAGDFAFRSPGATSPSCRCGRDASGSENRNTCGNDDGLAHSFAPMDVSP